MAVTRREQQMLDLREGEGLSYEEIGARLGIEPGTVAAKLRALMPDFAADRQRARAMAEGSRSPLEALRRTGYAI